MFMSMSKEERYERTEKMIDMIEELKAISEKEQLLKELQPLQTPVLKDCQS